MMQRCEGKTRLWRTDQWPKARHGSKLYRKTCKELHKLD